MLNLNKEIEYFPCDNESHMKCGIGLPSCQENLKRKTSQLWGRCVSVCVRVVSVVCLSRMLQINRSQTALPMTKCALPVGFLDGSSSFSARILIYLDWSKTFDKWLKGKEKKEGKVELQKADLVSTFRQSGESRWKWPRYTTPVSAVHENDFILFTIQE